MRQRLWWWVPALLIVTGLANDARGAVVVRMATDDLVHNSDRIVRGEVMRSESFRDDERGRIFTRHIVKVTETLKGPHAETVTVITMGGELPDVGQIVPGEAQLKPGEEVVLCLEDTRGGYSVVGMAQGKFVVDRSKKPWPLNRDTSGLLYVGEIPKPGDKTKGKLVAGKEETILTIETLRDLVKRGKTSQ